jgi:acyl dehydratase
MEINASFVGKRSKPFETTLSARKTMNYAAALGDNNAHYFDDARPEGIWAPPMMAVALTWPLSARFDEFWGDTRFPEEVRARQVHYNESLTWSRTMRPDERLSIQGEIVSMLQHPSGTLMTIRYEATGHEGDVVFTEHITALFRNVTLTDDGVESEPPPQVVDMPEDTNQCWSSTVPIDPLAAHLYDGCTDISFPIHTSVSFARQVGLPDTIYHGTATLGLAVREILNREGGSDPARLVRVQCGFRGMVLLGTEITVCVRAMVETGAERVFCFDVDNGAGEPALRQGRVHLK